ncbi:hypothetical protein BU15DRAFT_82129 [Melanogaster broomeanus]|nr:hypothetical protein BU15DRAFT_82129 [Melanogaster broomeanus]
MVQQLDITSYRGDEELAASTLPPTLSLKAVRLLDDELCAMFEGVEIGVAESPNLLRVVAMFIRKCSGSSPAESGYNSGRSSVEQRGRLIDFDSDVEDNDEVALAKAKECRRHKVEKKRREDEERRLREEEEQRRQEEEERRLREEEERRLREEEEAELRNCVRCAKAGVSCEFTNDGNKRRTACDRCAAQREKCEWPEMHVPRAVKGKAKANEVPTSPRQGEKKKRVRKAKVQDDDEVEIVGERMAGAGPSRVSLDRLVLAIEEMSDRMSELAQAQRESTRVSRRVAAALEDLVDEAACFGAPEELIDESSGGEEVDEEELREDLAGLEKELAESPMSPPRKQVT